MENKETQIKGTWNLHGYLILADGSDYYWAKFTRLPSPWKPEKQWIGSSGSCWVADNTIILSPRISPDLITVVGGGNQSLPEKVGASPKWDKTKYCVLFDWTGKVSELRNCETGRRATDKAKAAIMPNIVTLVKTVIADVPASFIPPVSP